MVVVPPQVPAARCRRRSDFRRKAGHPPETDNRSHRRAPHGADLSRCPGRRWRMRAVRSAAAGRPRVATLPGRSQAMPHVFARGRAAQECVRPGIVGHLSRYGSSRGARRNPQMHAGQGLCAGESRRPTGSAAPRMPLSRSTNRNFALIFVRGPQRSQKPGFPKLGRSQPNRRMAAAAPVNFMFNPRSGAGVANKAFRERSHRPAEPPVSFCHRHSHRPHARYFVNSTAIATHSLS